MTMELEVGHQANPQEGPHSPQLQDLVLGKCPLLQKTLYLLLVCVCVLPLALLSLGFWATGQGERGEREDRALWFTVSFFFFF